MKELLKSSLLKYLEKQRYPYLWEITLFSMLKKVDQEKFVTFVKKAIGMPKAAICLPQHDSTLRKGDMEIIDFIKRIQKNDKQVCVVVAHADYNPANLQALYVLDCEEGAEAKCFDSVFELWSHCSELFFLAMSIDSVIEEIVVCNKKPEQNFFKSTLSILTGNKK